MSTSITSGKPGQRSYVSSPAAQTWPASLLPCAFAAVAACVLIGCSQPDGPTRYKLSGRVTYDGQPIPFGRILLEPDTERGNSGPAGVAEITAGTHETRNGKGHVGGPHIATIIATDGTRPDSPDTDNSLFPPFRTKVDLPREDGRYDFEVPRTSPP